MSTEEQPVELGFIFVMPQARALLGIEAADRGLTTLALCAEVLSRHAAEYQAHNHTHRASRVERVEQGGRNFIRATCECGQTSEIDQPDGWTM